MSGEEREIREALRALAAADAVREAGPRVEAALLAEFDKRHSRRRTVWWVYAAAAAMAFVVAGAWLAQLWRRPVEPPRLAVRPAVVQPAPLEQAKKQQIARVRRPVVARRATKKQTEVATRFIPLIVGDDAVEGEAVPVVRVRLPRTVLASFGLPMTQDHASETVDADVVLNDAGAARAIRFVR